MIEWLAAWLYPNAMVGLFIFVCLTLAIVAASAGWWVLSMLALSLVVLTVSVIITRRRWEAP